VGEQIRIRQAHGDSGQGRRPQPSQPWHPELFTKWPPGRSGCSARWQKPPFGHGERAQLAQGASSSESARPAGRAGSAALAGKRPGPRRRAAAAGKPFESLRFKAVLRVPSAARGRSWPQARSLPGPGPEAERVLIPLLIQKSD